MRQQNDYRKINEDIAALKNIVWAAMQGFALDNDERRYTRAYQIYVISLLLLEPTKNTTTVKSIKQILGS